MRLINLIACEWLSRKNDRDKLLLNFSAYCAGHFHDVQVYESRYHTTPALQKICKRTESNQRPVMLTLLETMPKDTPSIQMQSEFQVMD